MWGPKLLRLSLLYLVVSLFSSIVISRGLYYLVVLLYQGVYII